MTPAHWLVLTGPIETVTVGLGSMCNGSLFRRGIFHRAADEGSVPAHAVLEALRRAQQTGRRLSLAFFQGTAPSA